LTFRYSLRDTASQYFRWPHPAMVLQKALRPVSAWHLTLKLINPSPPASAAQGLFSPLYPGTGRRILITPMYPLRDRKKMPTVPYLPQDQLV